jgi:hypothetical protein
MDAARDSSRHPLGEILVAAGLLTEPQLAAALEDQKRTGKKIGEIVVERGFVSRGAIANALAEQHGSLLKTEYGFGTGLGNRLRVHAAERLENGTPELAAVPEEDERDELIEKLQAEVKERDALIAAFEEATTKEREGAVQEAKAEVAERDEEIAMLKAKLDESAQHDEQIEKLKAELAAVRADAEQQKAAAKEAKTKLEQAEARAESATGLSEQLRAVEAEAMRLGAECEELKAAGDRLRQEIQKRDSVVGQLRAKIKELEAEVEELKKAPPPEPSDGTIRVWAEANAPNPSNVDSSYLLRVPTQNGFLLVERNGAAPQVGSEVEISEEPNTRFVVSKLVRSPLQGRYWVYLDAAEAAAPQAAAENN